MPTPDSVLVVKPGSLGDIVHALPCLRWISNTWPASRVSWIVDARWQGILEGVPGLSETIPFPRQTMRGVAGWAASVAWLSSLSRLQPCLALDLQGLLRSALMACASRAKLRIGGSDAREGAAWLYSRQAKIDPSQHAVYRYREVVAAAGADTSSPPEFPLGEGVRPAATIDTPFVLLHPYARGTGKSLSAEAVARLCTRLHPIPVVLAGMGPVPAGLPPSTINLLGSTTLPEFVWLARAAGLVISVDSGPAHIAAAVNDSLVCIHTWSDPRRVGPFNENALIWQGGALRRQQLGPDAPASTPSPFDSHHADALATAAKERFG